MLTDGFYNLAVAMIGPIYALFVEKVGGDLFTAGASFAAYSVSLGAVILIMGKIEDAFLKEKELWVSLGYFITALGFFSFLLVKSPLHLFIVQAALGVGEAIQSPAYNTVYAHHVDHQKAGFQWGSWDAMKNFTMAGGATIGALVASKFGFSSLFIAMGIMSLAGSLIIFFQPRQRL